MLLQGIGCNEVFEINGSRSRPEKRRAQLTLNRPDRPEWMDAEAYESCPRQIRVRQVVNRRRGYQDSFFIISLTDQRLVSAKEIVALYLRRWNVETDFRSAQVRSGRRDTELPQC